MLLLHDADDYSAPGSWRRTVAALPLVLDALAERGLEAVALMRPRCNAVLRQMRLRCDMPSTCRKCSLDVPVM